MARWPPDPLAVGLQPLDGYMSGLSQGGSAVDCGWLVIFDQRSHQPAISERTIAKRLETPAGCTVKLLRS